MGLLSAYVCENGIPVYMGLKLKSTNQKPEILKSHLKLGDLFDLMSRLFNLKLGNKSYCFQNPKTIKNKGSGSKLMQTAWALGLHIINLIPKFLTFEKCG